MPKKSFPHPVIFEEFPALRDAVPWMPLGEYPTPLQSSAAAAKKFGAGAFLVKRDDKSSPYYGGNKVRKLEFLLADARKRGARTLITFGAMGSNHLLATSIHGGRAGLRTVGVLAPQPVSAHMKKNLLLNLHFGTELVFGPSQPALAPVGVATFLRKWADDGVAPYLIPPGGSSALGTVGYVNAAFELKRQLADKSLPDPDYLFVPLGSNGTAAGLILGCRAAGMRTRVAPVLVSNSVMCNPLTLSALCNAANALLRKRAPMFPDCRVRPRDIRIITSELGEEYARYTPASVEAVRAADEILGLHLEGTYSGKAFAGLTNFCRARDVADKTVLFWNTYNSVDLSAFAETQDPSKLPKSIRRYYDMPNQPLDPEPLLKDEV